MNWNKIFFCFWKRVNIKIKNKEKMEKKIEGMKERKEKNNVKNRR